MSNDQMRDHWFDLVPPLAFGRWKQASMRRFNLGVLGDRPEAAAGGGGAAGGGAVGGRAHRECMTMRGVSD